MKKIITMTAVAAGLYMATNAVAGWNNNDTFVETKQLTLAASSLERLEIDAGAGSLALTGGDFNVISVTADIYQAEQGAKYCLSLDYLKENAKVAQLAANNCRGDARIDITITLPRELITEINDNAGRIEINNASVTVIEDGSGSIKIKNNHTVLDIKDGSGSIDVTLIEGDVRIEDGSGSIQVSDVAGLVTIKDGSGSIHVSNAGGFNLLSDGSGSVNLSNVNAKRM